MNRNDLIATALFIMTFSIISVPSTSHALEAHKNIKGLFNTTRDVVVKCLECHREIAGEVMYSTHWTWKRQRVVNGQNLMYGKKDSLSGFAIDIASNPNRCLSCHISGAPQISLFDNPSEAEVDCLVCHDTTGRYAKSRENKMLQQDDYEKIAVNVGKPAPENCTTCHFADCNLKDSSVGKNADNEKYDSQMDIHMADRTIAFSCQSCHQKNSGHSFSRTMSHGTDQISGSRGCASCHTESPHVIETLNQHSATISCRTCHIPQYATRNPAIISWNWMLTGKINPVSQTISGNDSLLQDSNGFTSSKAIRPVYMWDDGSDLVYTRGQRVKRQELTYLQKPSPKSENSKIAPFRVIYGTQLYDTKYRYLISPLLSAEGQELFPGQDWDTIAGEGMKSIVLPYSGQYGVAPTATYRRINHGVVPTEDALDCTDCHGSNSRLNWQELGYTQDPWIEKNTIQTGTDSSSTNTKQAYRAFRTN